MADYVMSDIHGEYNMYIKMLEKINFTEKDRLFIIGDVIDRGLNSIDVIEHIRKHKNIYLLKGNHEAMMVDALKYKDSYLWLYNWGTKTNAQLKFKSKEYIKELVDYLEDLEICAIVKDKFILAHASFPIEICDTVQDAAQEDDLILWDRTHIGNEKPYKDFIIINGHTPVQTIKEGYNSIIHQNGHIYIDCGACFKVGRLACLRLDDMQEFYIERSY